MSSYREEVNKYKAKRTGQTDAKVVAPKGKKKKVDKPWCVVTEYSDKFGFNWKPWRNYFEKEHDARAYLRKESNYGKWSTVWLEYNGEKVT